MALKLPELSLAPCLAWAGLCQGLPWNESLKGLSENTLYPVPLDLHKSDCLGYASAALTQSLGMYLRTWHLPGIPMQFSTPSWQQGQVYTVNGEPGSLGHQPCLMWGFSQPLLNCFEVKTGPEQLGQVGVAMPLRNNAVLSSPTVTLRDALHGSCLGQLVVDHTRASVNST